jgi:hypothetical protein
MESFSLADYLTAQDGAVGKDTGAPAIVRTPRVCCGGQIHQTWARTPGKSVMGLNIDQRQSAQLELAPQRCYEQGHSSERPRQAYLQRYCLGTHGCILHQAAPSTCMTQDCTQTSTRW